MASPVRAETLMQLWQQMGLAAEGCSACGSSSMQRTGSWLRHAYAASWAGKLHSLTTGHLALLTALLSSHTFSRNAFLNSPQVSFMAQTIPKLINVLAVDEMFYTWLWKRLCMTHEHQGFLQWMHKYVEKEEVTSRYLQARTGETHFWEGNSLRWLEGAARNKFSLNILYKENNLEDSNLYTLENLVMILKVCFG